MSRGPGRTTGPFASIAQTGTGGSSPSTDRAWSRACASPNPHGATTTASGPLSASAAQVVWTDLARALFPTGSPPARTEIVYALGLGADLVGVTFECEQAEGSTETMRTFAAGYAVRSGGPHRI